MTSGYYGSGLADFWFPVAPGVTVLPANPSPATNANPKPANYVDVPIDFDEDNPDLLSLFETILPRGVDPIYPVAVTPSTVIAPYNEIVTYDLRVRKYLVLNSFNYSLRAATEVGALTVKTKITIKVALIVGSPSISLQLEALPPSVGIVQKALGKVVEVVPYLGTGNIPKQLATRWPASMILLYRPDEGGWLWFDIARGTNAWLPNASDEFDLALQDPPGSLAFGEDAITIQGNYFNSIDVLYKAYIFKGRQESTENNAGSIPVNVYESDAFNILTYEGTGTSETIGHGLGEIPSLLIFKTGTEFGVVGGSFVGTNYYAFTHSSSPKAGSSSYINELTDSIIGIGTGENVNTNGALSTCYAFKQKENYCKIGTYYGNNLASGRSVDCGFNIGLVLVKNLTQDGKWLLLYEKDQNQGLRMPSWDNSVDFINPEPAYNFAGSNFTVYGSLEGTDSLYSLNLLGNEYLYVALAFTVSNRLFCPSSGVTIQALAPAILHGASIQLSIKSISFAVLIPPYIGERVALIVVRSMNVELQAHEPIISAGVNIALPVTTLELRARPVAYVGEVAEDGYEYVAIVEGLDGEPLEASVRGCAYSLIKDLKGAGLWSEFLTIVPTCMARTMQGALTPLTGRFPVADSLVFSGLSYSRRSGIRQLFTSGSIFTGVANNEISPTDNHIAAYVNQINDGSSGSSAGRLIGDGHTANGVNISRPTSSVGLSFDTRNKDDSTESSATPDWSQPSLVGITRGDSSSYVLRLANADRTISSSIVDQSEYLSFDEIGLLASSGVCSNFRVPFYSIGGALDLEVLEGVVETFLGRLDLTGVLSTKILPPSRDLQIEAKPPVAIG